MTHRQNPVGLALLILICMALLLPSLLAWAVNVELALHAMNIGTEFVQLLLPQAWYAALTPFAADLSTISTLVPLLLLVFPIFMGIRVLVLSRLDTTYVHRLIYDPYPPHFPFFLVMLGLTGTLYGLLIGLSVSGVADLAGAAPSADAIQETIDRLMGGTATALLSSLIGLVGAFLAARPLTWFFRRVACIPEEESQRNLVEVITSLTHDLQALGHASREFSERLNVASAERLDQRLTQIDTSLTFLAKGVGETNAHLGRMLAVQAQNAEHMAHLAELRRLAQVEAAVSTSTDQVTRVRAAMDDLHSEQEATHAAMEQAVTALHDGNRDHLEAMNRIQSVLTENSRDNRENRDALRKALGQYIGDFTPDSE